MNVVVLEVCVINVVALVMYEKCGFETRGLCCGYYVDGVDVVCMMCVLGECFVSM